MHPGDIDIKSDLELAIQLVELASGVILPHYQSCAIEWKQDGTEVTVADRAAEEVIRNRLATERPEDGVLGEEYGETKPSGDKKRNWIIDPIDGTAAFALGLPNFGTLIALAIDDEPVVGVIHLPALGETTYAAQGLGCWWRPNIESDPRRVQVASRVPLSEASASVGGPKSSDIHTRNGETPYRVRRLVGAVRKFRFVGDCVQHALVARGRLHLAVDTLMSPWDTAALVPCVEEAGGVTATVSGIRERVVFGGSLVTASDPTTLAETIQILSPEGP